MQQADTKPLMVLKGFAGLLLSPRGLMSGPAAIGMLAVIVDAIGARGLMRWLAAHYLDVSQAFWAAIGGIIGIDLDWSIHHASFSMYSLLMLPLVYEILRQPHYPFSILLTATGYHRQPRININLPKDLSNIPTKWWQLALSYAAIWTIAVFFLEMPWLLKAFLTLCFAVIFLAGFNDNEDRIPEDVKVLGLKIGPLPAIVMFMRRMVVIQFAFFGLYWLLYWAGIFDIGWSKNLLFQVFSWSAMTLILAAPCINWKIHVSIVGWFLTFVLAAYIELVSSPLIEMLKRAITSA